MANGRFVQEYQKSAVNGASPLQLVIMLYDGALRFMEAGKHAMLLKDVDRQNLYLQKSQKVLMELMSCLDMEKGGEVATNLFALYSYVLNELVTANCTDSAESIDRSMKIISQLRESWAELDKATRTESSEQGKIAA